VRVGFIGLGSMGGSQARQLAKTVPELVVYDAFPQAMKPFEGLAALGQSVADVGRRSECVGVCVRDDQQVREVLEGDFGLIAAMARGSVILIHSTVRPETIKDLAAEAARRGVIVIDAAVTRTVISGEGRFVCTMTGGAEAVTDRVRPVLDAFSTDIVHVGEVGSAMALKICNNLVTWVQILISRQCFRLAEAGGVPLDKLAQVMKSNGALTPVMASMMNNPLRFDSDGDRLVFMESQGRIGEKDLELAISLAEEVGVPLPTAVHAKEHVLDTMTGRLFQQRSVQAG